MDDENIAKGKKVFMVIVVSSLIILSVISFLLISTGNINFDSTGIVWVLLFFAAFQIFLGRQMAKSDDSEKKVTSVVFVFGSIFFGSLFLWFGGIVFFASQFHILIASVLSSLTFGLGVMIFFGIGLVSELLY